MRLLIALLEAERAAALQSALFERDERWETRAVRDGDSALFWLRKERWDLLLLHACLPGMDGTEVLRALGENPPLCPPRVLFLCDRDMPLGPARPDCIAPLCADGASLRHLLEVLSRKPLPSLAAARAPQVARAAEQLLDSLSMNRTLKGRAYIAWLLRRWVPSPLAEETPMGALYRECAQAFGVSAGSVERCLRVAVESVFTMGSISGIERVFGATVDPERGKPTNRAFLCQATQRLRLLLNGSPLGE